MNGQQHARQLIWFQIAKHPTNLNDKKQSIFFFFLLILLIQITIKT